MLLFGLINLLFVDINEFCLSMNMLDNFILLKYIMLCNCGVNFDF